MTVLWTWRAGRVCEECDDDEAGRHCRRSPTPGKLLRMPVCVQRGGVVGCHSELPAAPLLRCKPLQPLPQF